MRSISIILIHPLYDTEIVKLFTQISAVEPRRQRNYPQGFV